MAAPRLIRPVLVSQRKAAEMMGVSPNYVQWLIEEGVLTLRAIPKPPGAKKQPERILVSDLEKLAIPIDYTKAGRQTRKKVARQA